MRCWIPFLIVSAVLLAGAEAAQADPTSDMALVITGPDTSAADTDITFDLVMTNYGPDDTTNAAFESFVPAATSFVSVNQVSGATVSCTAPGVGDTSGAVTCTAASLASGASAEVSLVVHILPGTPPGSFITEIAEATSDNFDPDGEDDEGVAVTMVPAPPGADLRLIDSSAPGANADTDVTFTIEIDNGGPGDATTVELDDALPGDMTFVSLTQTSGPAWSCMSGVGTSISCTIAVFPNGASAVFSFVGHVPPATGDGMRYTDVPTVSSDFDPDSENNQGATTVCIQANGCAAGACNAFQAVICPAAATCENQGTCDTNTALCSANTPNTGNPCDDGDACTQTDTCAAGVCTGSNPVQCAPAFQCQIQGVCNPATGICSSNDPGREGEPCDDENACTLNDVCMSGDCVGTGRITCPAAGPCATQGICNPGTGLCLPNVPLPDGTGCSDGNLCVTDESCQAGACVGTPVVTCPAAAQCQVQGTCDAQTGECTANVPVEDGSGCDDGDACTQTDSCLDGGCVGGDPVVCPPAGACEVQGSCDPTSGACAPNTPRDCDDHDPCTADSCDEALGCVHTVVCDAGVNQPDAAIAVVDAAVPVDARPPSDARPAGDAGSGADARIPDAGDAGAGKDAGTIIAGSDAGVTPASSSGCSCRTGAGEPFGPVAPLFLVGLFVVARLGRARRVRR